MLIVVKTRLTFHDVKNDIVQKLNVIFWPQKLDTLKMDIMIPGLYVFILISSSKSRKSLFPW